MKRLDLVSPGTCHGAAQHRARRVDTPTFSRPRATPICLVMQSFHASLLLALGLAAAIGLMIGLVRWARRRSTGALTVGALLSLFAPDPTLERNIRLAEEARQVQVEEDEEGQGKDPQ